MEVDNDEDKEFLPLTFGWMMDISQALREAADIVETAGLRVDFQAVAFEKALGVLLGPTDGGTGAKRIESEQPPPIESTQGPMVAIARKLGVDPDIIGEVYELHDDVVDIILGHSRIAEGAAAGTRQLAVLVAAGRQAAGLDADGWTGSAEIREVCKDFTKYDQANFSGTLGKMHDYFSVSGKGAARRVKLTRAGWEYATKLISDLTA